jgi:hypothetical protein
MIRPNRLVHFVARVREDVIVNSFKPLVTLVVLGGIGFVVYNQLNSKTKAPPPGAPTSWDVPPQLQMPGESGTAATWGNGGSAATSGFLPAAAMNPGGTAAAPAATSPNPTEPTNPANPWNTNPPIGDAGPPSSAPPAAYGQANDNRTPAADEPATFGRVEPEGYGSTAAAHYGDAPRANYGEDTADQRWGTTDPAAAAAATTAGGYGSAQQPTEPIGSVARNEPYASQAQDDAYGGSAAPPRSTAAGGDAEIVQQFQVAWDEGIRMLDEGRLSEGLAKLSEWYEHPRLSAAEHGQLTDLLDQVAGTVIYSTQHHLEPAHVVKAGETLESIGEQYQVPWQLLAKVNGIDDPKTVQPGEQLKVVRGPFDATISLEKRQLSLMLKGMYAGRFVVGIGRDMPPREGTFAVGEKVESPTYHGRDRTIEANDPANPLGKRLIALDDNLSIHGTGPLTDLSSTNQPGCISLGSRDVEDVFDILGPGSKVLITR